MKLLKALLDGTNRYRFVTPAFLLAIMAMIILPLPPFVLDVLFTFNIVLALIVILVSVSARRPLDFSVFPSVILATTLMRLTLNVASTRVVLLHGHEGTDAAGRVIEAFGQVVIGGNYVVGLVVFVILMIINFVVVTKGAERISEVSARFTLDALPGKQMAIDADLNAGLINQEAAMKRRNEVSMEADFYGAMDGAAKFVRGDAVASILILVINIVGGVAIGALMQDMSFGAAFRQYALLTIGDGLVAQIPALLLSAAAAIIVTRVSDSGDFEQQVGNQLLANPNVLFGAAGVLAIIGLVPGMPWLIFLTCAAVLAYVAWRISQRVAQPPADNLAAVEAALRDEEPGWSALPVVPPLQVLLGYKLVGLAAAEGGKPLVKRLRGMRLGVSEAMGVLLPKISVCDDLSLQPAEYAIMLGGTQIARAEVYPDQLMAIPAPTVYGKLDGIPAIDPAYGMAVTWIVAEQKSYALGMGYQVVEVPNVIATHVSKLLREHLPELVQHDDVAALMERVADLAPKLSAALDKVLTHTQLLRVFRVLLAENISLKDIVPICSTLVDAADTTKDPILLAAEVRCTLRRQIVAALCGTQAEIKAFNVGAELEDLLLGALNQARQSGKVVLDNYPVDPELLEQLQTHLPKACEQMKQEAVPPVLLVTPQLRPLLARYARMFAHGLHVLSYNEIPESRQVSILGTVG